jgi:hypothetical protein
MSLTLFDNPKSTVVRNVTKEDKVNLREKLLQYHQDMINKMNVNKMVTCPNHILEFNNFHVNQVIEHCHKLFTFEDVLGYVEIWRHEYAVGILKQISEVFGDIGMAIIPTIEEHDLEHNFSTMSDWDQIRDDSTLVGMIDSQDLEGVVSFMDSCNNESSMSLCNTDTSE